MTVEFTIREDFRDLIPPLAEDELAQLKENIVSQGCRDALVVWQERAVLLDGHNRYTICNKHGITYDTREISLADDDAATMWIIDNQQGRRNLSKIDRIDLARRKEEILRRQAKERSGTRTDLGAKLPPGSGKTRQHAAKEAGVGERTYDAGKAVLEAVEKGKVEPGVIQQIREGKKSIHSVATDIARAEKESRREERRAQNREQIAKAPEIQKATAAKYSTIVIDPPWDWGDEGDQDQLGRARPTYSTMSFDQLLSFPVMDRADRDSHIYLWITNRSLPKGFALLEAWGFRYVTCLTWCKPSIGMGNYFRGSTEQVLFGVRGSQPIKRKDVGTWFSAPRGKAHSSKPESFIELVESCSPGPYLEIFAREKRDGWTCWGGEL